MLYIVYRICICARLTIHSKKRLLSLALSASWSLPCPWKKEERVIATEDGGRRHEPDPGGYSPGHERCNPPRDHGCEKRRQEPYSNASTVPRTYHQIQRNRVYGQQESHPSRSEWARCPSVDQSCFICLRVMEIMHNFFAWKARSVCDEVASCAIRGGRT
jgi:hypothetical protein